MKKSIVYALGYTVEIFRGVQISDALSDCKKSVICEGEKTDLGCAQVVKSSVVVEVDVDALVQRLEPLQSLVALEEITGACDN